MATKPSDLLNCLPSASELLEKPPIRALAARWNRSVVAAGVRSFLDELRSDLERRAGDMQLPSLRDLAERAARYVAQLQQPSVRPAINATGRFFGSDWSSAPLADEALDRLVAFGGGFVPRTEHSSADVAATLCRLTRAEAATVVSSYAGAVWLTLAAIGGEKQVLVARGEVSELEPDCSLAAVAASAQATLQEVGSVNRISAADYEAAITSETGVILRNLADDFRIVGQRESVELESLVGLARDRELPLVDLLGAAPLLDNLPALNDSLQSVTASIATGAHLTITRGNGLVGGPACGVIVGARGLIHRIEAHPMFAAWCADLSTTAALDATLIYYDDPQRLQQKLPLFQLRTTSVENLRQRAERLAPQCAQAEDVEHAAAVPTAVCMGLTRHEDDPLPSYAIALHPSQGDVAALDRRLRSAPVPIIGHREADRLLIDLRTVLPRQDQRLVEQIAGQQPPICSEGLTASSGN